MSSTSTNWHANFHYAMFQLNSRIPRVRASSQSSAIITSDHPLRSQSFFHKYRPNLPTSLTYNLISIQPKVVNLRDLMRIWVQLGRSNNERDGSFTVESNLFLDHRHGPTLKNLTTRNLLLSLNAMKNKSTVPLFVVWMEERKKKLTPLKQVPQCIPVSK